MDAFFGSPRGQLTPRVLSRTVSMSTASPVDLIKLALVQSRNELVMLFTRWDQGRGAGQAASGQGRGKWRSCTQHPAP